MTTPGSPPPDPAPAPGFWRRLLQRALTPIGRGKPGDPPTSDQERRRAFQILFLSLACLGIGQAGMFAILPPVSRELNLTEFQVGAIFAISATIWVFSSAFWGARSDNFGRRPMIVLGLLAFAVSTFLFATTLEIGLLGLLPMAIVYPMMIASRCIYGIFGSSSFPAAQGYIADRTSPAERTQAVAGLNAAFGLGTMVGPGVIGGLTYFGIIAPLYFIAILAFASAFAIWRFLPERTAPAKHEHEASAPLSWRDPVILPFILFGVLMGTAGSFPIQTVAFFFMDVLKLTAEDAIQLSGVGLMASSAAALIAQMLIVPRFKLSAASMMRWGIITGIASYVFFVIGYNFGMLVTALILSGLGFGLIRPAYGAAVSLSVPKDRQGAAAGLTGGASASGFIFAPLIGNALYAYDPHAPYVLGGVMMLALLIFAITHPSFRRIDIAAPEETETPVPKS